MLDEAGPRLQIAAICGGHRSSIEQLVPQIPLTSALSCLVSCASSVTGLADALRTATGKQVIDVRGDVPLEGERIYVLPTDREVVIHDKQLIVSPPNGHGKVDRLLRSVADSVGRDCISVILAGDGDAGTLGLKRIKENGGLVICQQAVDPDSDDMAAVAVSGGFVDLVLPFEEIAPRIEQLVRSRGITIPPLPEDAKPPEPISDALRDILTMMRLRTGHDFTWYKRATLFRRIARRMQVCQTETISDYVAFLRERPTELGALLRDFLISVTNFFRDPDVFEAIQRQVIPRLFRNKTSTDHVRVWVAGCATGEEAYSFGMLLAEYASRLPDPPELQVFATDIDEAALQDARAGIYPAAIETDVSAQRLTRFFTRENSGYRVNQELREMMLFSPHNVLRDPPFSRLDLVSCRNLLIYLNRDAQDRVLTTFHFALKPDGILVLGSSESAESTHLFALTDAKNRIFERRGGPRSIGAESLIASGRWTPSRPSTPAAGTERPPSSYGDLHHRVVEQYAPPSVLVNEELDVVHLSEHVGSFLTMQGGEPTRHILRLVHPLLRFELRGAIYAARQPDRGSDTRVVRFEEGGRTRVVELRVRCVDMPDVGRGTMLILFDELDAQALNVVAASDAHVEPVVREMEDELHRTRDQLRTTVEQYETSLEELKASNEELHAINEELRSATEELETSKEELQSVNEELSTLNHELKDKIDEVTRINSDLQNLMSSTDIGVLFLDRTLRIKRFTPRTQELFNIIPSDVGRPFAHVTHQLASDELVQLAQRVLVDLRSTEREVTSSSGRRYLARFLPYRSLDDRIEGVVLTFVEITELKHAEEARERSEAEVKKLEERLAFALRGAPIAVLALDQDLQVTWGFVHGRELSNDDGAKLLFLSPDQAELFRDAARDVQTKGVPATVELEVMIEGAPSTYEFRIEPGRPNSSLAALTAVGFDMTPSKLALKSLHESDRRKDEFLATLSHELRNPLTPLRVALDVVQMPNVDQKEIAKAHAIMSRELHTLVRLVDDLLDLSRVTHGKVHLDMQPVALVRAIESALESTRPAFDAAKHRVNVELPPSGTIVTGDLGRLTQVFTNLLGNASKYTPDGGTIDLKVDTLDGEYARIVIRDSGVGIAPELLPEIFEIFVQSRDDQGRSRGGLGIGLNLVRKLVELHGGRVSAESAGLGKGSTFTVELPLRRVVS